MHSFTCETDGDQHCLMAPSLLTGIVSGLLISRWLALEQLTALLASAPGGISDMSWIALDIGTKSPTV